MIRYLRALVKELHQAPRPVRALLIFGALPIPGPFDELALLIAGAILWLFYRPLLKQAHDQAKQKIE